MRTYEKICPICGVLNRRLYLEETGGVMECVRCGAISGRSYYRKAMSKEMLMETEKCPELKLPRTIHVPEDTNKAYTSASCMV